MPSRLDYALCYAALGWPVLPCNGKLPDGALVPHGFKNATRDADRLRAWWGERPEANLGIPCGEISGFWVLDVDPRNGGNEELQGLFPDGVAAEFKTLVQKTGSGGRHFLFKHDARVRKGKLGRGLDVKRGGGYIVVEPSETASRYAFVDWDPFTGELPPIETAPAWLLAMVAAPVAPASSADGAREPWNADLTKLRSALAVLPSDDYIGEWLPVGAALYHSSAGHADALALWEEWSRKSAKFEPDACAKKWSTFDKYAAARATIASIYWRAQQAGWRWGKPKSSDRGSEPPPPDQPEGGTDDEDKRPTIDVRQGELPRAADEAESALLQSGERLYQRSAALVRVVRRAVPTVRNYKRDAGVLGLSTIDPTYLVDVLTRIARWRRWDPRAEKWRHVDCPDKVAHTLLARNGRWRLPKLWSVISAPTLRPDGTLLQTPGYDPATSTWYDSGDIKFPVVADTPSREDAEAALELLAKAVSTFPFVAEFDRSVMLALMLTALVRRALPSAPLGAFTAPTMGSGKTLLADVISILATGVAAPAMRYADTDEEAAKTALAVLSEGDPVVLIDNVERPLQGDWLCTVLTSETYRGRILGRSEMVSVPTSTLFLATGNQLVIKGDLRTRALMCRIDPQVERPEERRFGHDLREWMAAHRPRLVAAGLTLMRAFLAAKVEPDEVVPPWGRFERWSALVRAPLVWIGQQDPCASLKVLEAEDPARTEHLHVLTAWFTVFRDEPKTARDVVEQVISPAANVDERALRGALEDVIGDRTGQLNPRRLGAWVRARAGRRVSGYQIVKASETRDGVYRWKVDTLIPQ